MSAAGPAAIPLTPDAAQARGWLIDELAKPPYQAARPTLFDQLAQGFVNWFESLFEAKGGGAPSVFLVIALLVLAALVVTGLVLFGLPSFNRRSRATGGLFGDDDVRTAEDLRRAALAAERAGDWSAAVLDRFRAIARALDERTLVAVFPGTTASAFARSAAAVFATEQGALVDAAALFDGVRYAGEAATRDQAERLRALDERLAAARPRLPEPVGA